MEIFIGIEPNDSGTGRLLRFLLPALSEKRAVKIINPPTERRLILRAAKKIQFTEFKNELKGYIQSRKYFLERIIKSKSSDVLLIVHPQGMGYFWSCLLLSFHRAKKKNLILLDSSFFCRSSYNHVDSESSACVRCVGGHFSAADHFNCPVFPTPSVFSKIFLNLVLNLAKKSELQFIAQNPSQAKLAKKHFGQDVLVCERQIWTIDFEELSKVILPSQGEQNVLVFHGSDHHAKGAVWLRELSKYLPEYRFLFPFNKPKGWPDSDNCYFQNMTWETGLREHVIHSAATFCPSLWSAPIEGALVKSLFLSKKVVVVKNETSFSHDIPEEILMTLSHDHKLASEEFRQKIKLEINQNQLKQWKIDFLSRKYELVNHLIKL